MNPHVRYRVTGHAGIWAYAGQAQVIDDEGRAWDHDYVLMHQVADPDNTVCVAPSQVRPLVPMSDTLREFFADYGVTTA